MKLFDHIYKAVNPLKYAIKKGMHVGKGVTLASKSGTSFGSEPYLITLEDEVRISGAATFITHDGGTWAIRDLDDYKEVVAFGPIHVGYRTFIGYKATIMPGVKIGKRCIIGAGALVTKDIPDESVAVGVPARVIGSVYDYGNKQKANTDKIVLAGYDPKEKRKSLERIFCNYFSKTIYDGENNQLN